MTKRVPVSITDEMHERLSEYANERGQTLSYVIREAIAAYLERSKVRIKEVHPGWGGTRGKEE